ncbi:hypothetical protein ACWEKM_46655, partial [Streptomyces sp. NPDC004752]
MSSSSGEPLAVVAVHGVGYRDPRATAEDVRARHIQSWTRHLADGMGVETARLTLNFAYYAHLLYPGPVVQGPQDTDELQEPPARGLTAAWLAELGAPRPVAQGVLTMPLRYAASWVAEKFSLDGRLTELFIRVFFREVATYLADIDSAARAVVREEVVVVRTPGSPYLGAPVRTSTRRPTPPDLPPRRKRSSPPFWQIAGVQRKHRWSLVGHRTAGERLGHCGEPFTVCGDAVDARLLIR